MTDLSGVKTDCLVTQTAKLVVVEIHDASAENGHAALFGFIGYDAQARAQLGATELKTMAVEQLARLFG